MRSYFRSGRPGPDESGTTGPALPFQAAGLGEFGVVGVEFAVGFAFFQEDVGDAVEGDAHGGVGQGAQRAAVDDGVFAELFVDVIQRGVERGTAVAVVHDAGEHGGVGFGGDEFEERDADAEQGGRGAGAAGPEESEDADEFEGVLGLREGGGGAPAFAGAGAEAEVESAGVETGVAEAGGGFLEEAVESGFGAGGVAEVGGEDLGVADG